MSQVVAIAGGSGGLGRAIVEALKERELYQPLILSRKGNPALEEEVGVPVLKADYTDQSALVQLLEDHNIDTVISTIAGLDLTSELNLIAAADGSRTTTRFLPSIWSGFDYTHEDAKISPMARARITLQDAMIPTNLQHTAIFPGVFLDFYTLALPSHVRPTVMAIDMDANAAAIPGSGTYPVPFTHTSDIAAYTVRLLGLAHWEPKYYLAGDTKTWEEVVALAEKAKGVRFDVQYDSVEQMKEGELSELPGYRVAYEKMGGEAMKPLFLKGVAQLAVWMAEGRMRYPGPFLDEVFPGWECVTVERALGVE